MIAALLDHLWQSTLFAVVICLLMPAFRRNSAAVRFWLWFAASVKFLIPLSLFTIAGRHLLAPVVPEMPVRILSVITPVATPFSAGTPVFAAPAAYHLMILDLAAAAWVLGGLAVLAFWFAHWMRLRTALRHATDLPLTRAVPVKSTDSRFEPGLVGIWRPVILLPEGIAERLSATEMEAVMAHELCHLRRRDNLLAAVHMLVEAVFWFHPLVWWLGSRLVEEREHACDESVLAAGNQPLVYAEGILKVCRFYVQSPLACASGVSGAALTTRVGAILRNQPADDVEGAKSALLVCVAALSVMLPLLAGGLGAGPVTGLASRVATVIATQAQMLPMPSVTISPTPVATEKTAVPVHRLKRRAEPGPTPAQSPALPAVAPLAMIAPPAVDAIPAPSVPAPADVSANDKAAGDDAIVCRLPQLLPGSRLAGPQVCRTKAEWAELRAQGKDISPDGRFVVAADGEKQRSLNAQFCRPATMGGGGATTAVNTIFSPVCF
jgi:beta-lactamase regulating signal transducer with metallopeptidase domain